MLCNPDDNNVYIYVSDLPAALAARGIEGVSSRKAASIATKRKLPFFHSPLDGRLVITPDQLNEALVAPAAQATREWRAQEEARAKSEILPSKRGRRHRSNRRR
jgi:hypothetical protein